MNAMTKRDYDRLYSRMQRLPEQLIRARLRVRQLEALAREYRMHEILADPAKVDTFWELEVAKAR